MSITVKPKIEDGPEIYLEYMPGCSLLVVSCTYGLTLFGRMSVNNLTIFNVKHKQVIL